MSGKLHKNGVPLDAADWTEQDWRDLHEAIDAAVEKIAARHRKPVVPAPQLTCCGTPGQLLCVVNRQDGKGLIDELRCPSCQRMWEVPSAPVKCAHCLQNLPNHSPNCYTVSKMRFGPHVL